MQEIAKYILSQLPRLNDSELDQISSLATTIQVSRRVRNPHKENPLLTHGVGYAKGFHIIDELDNKETDIDLESSMMHKDLKGDWVVSDKEPL